MPHAFVTSAFAGSCGMRCRSYLLALSPDENVPKHCDPAPFIVAPRVKRLENAPLNRRLISVNLTTRDHPAIFSICRNLNRRMAFIVDRRTNPSYTPPPSHETWRTKKRREQLELLQFNWNGGSASSPDLVGSALLLERTGTPASNTTGPLEQVDPSTSSASSSSVATAALQTVGGSSSSSAAATTGSTVVGVATDIYCFQNDPYDCEAYFGDSDGEIAVQLTGTVRCNACQGSAFTGIGSAAGAPTPAPIVTDDDDGLSQMGQERAQGGTPSPAGVDGSSSSSGAGSGLGLVPEEESEPELLGTTGTMRWVVVGLIAALGSALLICLCMLTVCRRRKGRGESALELAGGDGGGGDAEEGSTSAMVGPRPLSTSAAADDTAERGLGVTSNGHGNGGGSSKSQPEFCATSPGTSTAVNVNGEQSRSRSRSGSRRTVAGAADPSSSSSRRPSGTESSRSSSRRPSGAADLSRSSSRRPSGKEEGGGGRDPRRETVDSAVAVVNVETPLSSELRERELARQRSVELKAAREEEGWMSPPLVSAWGEGAVVGGNGHVALSARNTPTKRGFAALPDDATAGEESRGRRGSRRSAASRRGSESSPSERTKRNHSSAEAAEAAAVSVSVPRGMKGRKSRSAGKSRSGARPFGGGREDDEDEDSEAPAPSRGLKDRRSKSADKAIGHAFAPQDGSALLSERRGSRSGPRAYGSGGLTASGHPRKIKPPATGGGGDSDRFTPPRERSTDRALTRAVKTPAGGARLPISVAAAAGGASVGPPRGLGFNTTATAAADAAGAAAKLGRRQRGGEAAVVSAEVNPFYSRGGESSIRGGGGSRSPKSSGSRSHSRVSSRSPRGERSWGGRSRSRSSSRRGDERAAAGGGGDGGGWAAEMYRVSPGPRSAKVYSRKFGSSQPGWGEEEEGMSPFKNGRHDDQMQ